MPNCIHPKNTEELLKQFQYIINNNPSSNQSNDFSDDDCIDEREFKFEGAFDNNDDIIQTIKNIQVDYENGFKLNNDSKKNNKKRIFKNHQNINIQDLFAKEPDFL